MSDELSPAQAAILRQLGPLDGQEIPGGCDHCDAYQKIELVERGLWMLNVYHDDACPFLAQYEGRT